MTHDEAPLYLQDMLKPRLYSYNTRQAANQSVITLVIPAFRKKTFASRGFSESGPRVWNALPTEIRSCNNLTSFKQKLKTHYFQQAFD